MMIEEKHKDLFTVSDDYHLAHCIATDMRMGAGIALPMQKKFRLRAKIRNSNESILSPTCILTGRVFNLITKRRSSGKPTYQSLQASLVKMREIIEQKGVTKLAMPKIGCGLDRLNWAVVRQMLEDIFYGLEIEILVCVWK